MYRKVQGESYESSHAENCDETQMSAIDRDMVQAVSLCRVTTLPSHPVGYKAQALQQVGQGSENPRENSQHNRTNRQKECVKRFGGIVQQTALCRVQSQITTLKGETKLWHVKEW